MMHGLLRIYMHAGAISSRSSAVARVAEVLNRRRALTIDMIRRLHEGLGLSADALIRPYDLRERRSA
jgi:antitoxin component HigA of HigAB toxin-antitoxin module